MMLFAVGFPGGLALLWAWLFYGFMMFWFVMAVDAVLYQQDQRSGWILTICFAPIIGAVVYFFAALLPRRSHKGQ